MTELLAGIDPGRDKCGLAVANFAGECVFREVVPTSEMEVRLKELEKQYAFRWLVMGNGTTSKRMLAAVKEIMPHMEIAVVDEFRTTDQARSEYWKINKPKGLKRFIPKGLLVPPEPVDDLAALILIRRYLQGLPEG